MLCFDSEEGCSRYFASGGKDTSGLVARYELGDELEALRVVSFGPDGSSGVEFGLADGGRMVLSSVEGTDAAESARAAAAWR